MVKVIHFTSCIRRGGIERQVSEIIRYSKNIEHIWVSLHYSKDNYLNSENKWYTINSRNIIKRIKEFNKVVKSFKPMVVVCWDVAPYIIALFSKGIRRNQIINASIQHGILKKTKRGYLRMFIAHLSKYVMANSQAGLRVNKLKKGIILYNGVNERFNKENYIKEDQSPNKRDYPILVSIMNMILYKDYFTIFKSLELLKLEGINFTYYIIGDGPLRANYELYLSKSIIKNNVFLLGNIISPEEYLGKADIFIHSSKGEGVSNAILEAMYMGLPIITTDTGGTLEILDGNAITFSYQDYQALYNALTTLINDEKLRKEMGKKSHSIVKERFTTEHMVKNYERIINAVINKNIKSISDLIYNHTEEKRLKNFLHY
jgi:glycosyltransferase involved in cell wall biosynthesis